MEQEEIIRIFNKNGLKKIVGMRTWCQPGRYYLRHNEYARPTYAIRKRGDGEYYVSIHYHQYGHDVYERIYDTQTLFAALQ